MRFIRKALITAGILCSAVPLQDNGMIVLEIH